MSKKRSSYSSSSSVDGGGAMWLDVAEDDELVGGTKLRLTVNKMEQGKGNKVQEDALQVHIGLARG